MRWKPVTPPIAEHGLEGQAGGGVRFVLPSTLACSAPADETATTPMSAAHRAAKAMAWRARCRRPVVDSIVPVIGVLGTARRTGLGPRRAVPPWVGLRCERID